MQSSMPAALIRGGTSRGLFLRMEDLPDVGPTRDALLLELLGSPDPIQVDGVGGGHSHTSKVMAVEVSAADGVDIDYLFAQVDVRQAVVDYQGNCGNLTAAVATHAIERGLVAPAPARTEAEVVLHNLNTGTLIRVTVPLERGMPRVQGTYRMAGVREPGAEIRVEYLDPEGALLGRGPLPVGGPLTPISLPGGEVIEVSIADVTGLLVFVRATDLGLVPPFLPDDLNGDSDLLARIEAVRAACAQRLGMVERPQDAARVSPSQPKVVLCAPVEDYMTSTGRSVSATEVDLIATMSSVQRIHHAFAGTGVMCTAAAARLEGTIPFMLARPGSGDVRVGHPKGVATASVDIRTINDRARVASITVSRTARTIMSGAVYHRVRS